MSRKSFVAILLSMFLLYLNIILLFAFIYLFFDLTRLGPIVDHYASETLHESWLDRLARSIYFSAITLISVGYGDVTPFGLSKAIAISQAMLGYVLPPAIVLKYVWSMASSSKKKAPTFSNEHDGT